LKIALRENLTAPPSLHSISFIHFFVYSGMRASEPQSAGLAGRSEACGLSASSSSSTFCRCRLALSGPAAVSAAVSPPETRAATRPEKKKKKKKKKK
jgi:hypothetical protein